MLRSIVLAVVGLFILPNLLFAQTNGRKLALLVGVKEYEHAGLDRLNYTDNDVTDLADLLKGSGYTVVLMTEASAKKDDGLRPILKNIRTQLQNLTKGGKRQDLAIVALSGHGIQFEMDSESYFCPTDARPTIKEKETMLSFSEILKTLEDNGVGVKLLMADACRNDPTSGRGIDTRSIRPPKGSGILLSCSKGQRAFEAAELKHGIFFHYVLEGLRGKAINAKGEITWSSLTEYVAEHVTTDVPRIIGEGARQEPNAISDFNGKAPLLMGKTKNPDAIVAINRGDEFFAKDDAQQALVEYSKAVQVEPREPEYLNRKARALILLREYDKAEKELDAALKIDPSFIKAYTNKGIIALNQGQNDRAIGNFDNALGLDPRHELSLVSRGRAYSAKREFDKALKDIDAAIALSPKSALNHYYRGSFNYYKGDYEASLKSYDRAIQLKPQDSAYLANRADVFNSMKSFDKAIEDLNKAIELNPKVGSYYNVRGWTLTQKKEYDRAIPDYTKAIEIEPKRAPFWRYRGDARFDKGEYDLAITDYDESIRLDNTSSWVWNQRGRAYYAKKQFAEAIRDFSMAIETDPKIAVNFKNRGVAYTELKTQSADERDGNLDKAIADLTRAVELSPNYFDAYSWRGWALFEKRQYARAIQDCTKAIEGDPKQYCNWANRADARFELGAFDLALADYNKAIQLNGKVDRNWNQRGRIYYNQKKDYGNALTNFSKAVELNPNDPVYYENRALANTQLGNKLLADQDVAKAKQMRGGK